MIPYVWKKWRGAGTVIVLLALTGLLAQSSLAAPHVAAATCQSVAVNGEFENETGWQTSSSGSYSLFSDFLAHSGTQSAHLAGVDNATDSAVTTFALPADNTITLSFWWLVSSLENGSGYDSLSLLLTDSQGTPLYAVAGLTDLNASASWQQTSADLSAFAGQNVQLHLTARTDGSLVTDFFVDDLTVTACANSAGSLKLFLPMTSRNQ
ncbi:MAG: hypothetical protein KF753_14360 [Caldilineaceae bacterium]|nr:hypothetical protein [Caldilineaceae bacterium]